MRRLLLGFGFATICVAQAPSPDVFKQVLEKQLLALRPDGFSERQVLFQDVRPLAKNGAFYPFQVTAAIRDYGPGYPANRFYGTTCVGQMDKWTFNLGRNDAGAWEATGRMTVTSESRQCKNNPSAGVSSIPLASLSGSPAPKGAIAGSAPATGPAELHIGQWACYGSGGRLLIGLGFYLNANGSYQNLDRNQSGHWTRTADGLSFQGGHLNGQSAHNLRGNHFNLSSTVSCEPWR